MRIRFVVIVMVLAVVIAACTGGGHRSRSSRATPTTSAIPSSPTVSVSVSPTRTGPLTTGPGVRPGETPPVLSEAAKQHTPTGALLFAHYYFEAYDWGIATTDPYLVQVISAPTCSACHRFIADLDTLRRNGGHVEHGRTNILSSKLVYGSFATKSEYVVEFNVSEDAVVLVNPPAPPSTSAPASRYRSLIFVSWRGRGWQVIEEGAPS